MRLSAIKPKDINEADIKEDLQGLKKEKINPGKYIKVLERTDTSDIYSANDVRNFCNKYKIPLDQIPK